MLWVVLSRLPDILSFVGFLTVIYWTVRFTIQVSRVVTARKASRTSATTQHTTGEI